MVAPIQMTFADDSEEYREFVEKFKPRKTTDDCYTPENVYDAIADWVSGEYGIARADMVRPFWPGGDFEREEYPDGCCVVDNPPFSILSKICKFYQANGIPFFLFAPALTLLNNIRQRGVSAVCASCSITYGNGAEVNTSFLTNLEGAVKARSAPSLHEAVKAADDENVKAQKKQLDKYEYPDEVVTGAKLGWMSVRGEDFRIMDDDCAFVSQLDAMKAAGKSGIFGGGLLLSERAAAERAAAERAAAERAAATKWQLSERERKASAMLGKGEGASAR